MGMDNCGPQLQTYRRAVEWLRDGDLIHAADEQGLLAYLEAAGNCWHAGDAEGTRARVREFEAAFREVMRRERLSGPEVQLITGTRGGPPPERD